MKPPNCIVFQFLLSFLPLSWRSPALLRSKERLLVPQSSFSAHFLFGVESTEEEPFLFATKLDAFLSKPQQYLFCPNFNALCESTTLTNHFICHIADHDLYIPHVLFLFPFLSLASVFPHLADDFPSISFNFCSKLEQLKCTKACVPTIIESIFVFCRQGMYVKSMRYFNLPGLSRNKPYRQYNHFHSNSHRRLFFP